MSVTRHMPDNSPGPTGSACPGYPRGVWPPLLSAFCADTSPTNQRHPDCSVPGCICPCHSRPQATWKLESRGVMPSNNVEDFSPQVESVGLMESWSGWAVTVIAPKSLPADGLQYLAVHGESLDSLVKFLA